MMSKTKPTRPHIAHSEHCSDLGLSSFPSGAMGDLIHSTLSSPTLIIYMEMATDYVGSRRHIRRRYRKILFFNGVLSTLDALARTYCRMLSTWCHMNGFLPSWASMEVSTVSIEQWIGGEGACAESTVQYFQA